MFVMIIVDLFVGLGGVPAPAQARRGGGAAPAPQAAEVAEVANGGVIQR